MYVSHGEAGLYVFGSKTTRRDSQSTNLSYSPYYWTRGAEVQSLPLVKGAGGIFPTEKGLPKLSLLKLFQSLEAGIHWRQRICRMTFRIDNSDTSDYASNREPLEAIDAAYDDSLDPQERTILQEMRRKHRQLVEGEW